MMTQQGYAPDDILPEGKKVNLRQTPTFLRVVIIDVTETIDLCQRIGSSHGNQHVAWAQWVDLIIPDKTQPASKENSFHLYELNFDPAMYIHTPIKS